MKKLKIRTSFYLIQTISMIVVMVSLLLSNIFQMNIIEDQWDTIHKYEGMDYNINEYIEQMNTFLDKNQGLESMKGTLPNKTSTGNEIVVTIYPNRDPLEPITKDHVFGSKVYQWDTATHSVKPIIQVDVPYGASALRGATSAAVYTDTATGKVLQGIRESASGGREIKRDTNYHFTMAGSLPQRSISSIGSFTVRHSQEAKRCCCHIIN